MAQLPKDLQKNDLADYLVRVGSKLISQGKVRDTYDLSGGKLLVVASDRISVFDFVLNALIPKKGEVLTALTHFWLTEVLQAFDNQLVLAQLHPAYFDRGVYPNAAYDIKEKILSELPIERCLVVKNLSGKMYPFELIYRHHIGGSVFKSYQKTGLAGGHKLPLGLPKWSKLDSPIFTPSTKEEVGHDVNVDFNYFFATMKKNGLGKEAHEVAEMLAEAYAIAYKYAEEKDILILDTKFEVAGKILADEILTPDSSRFALKADWEQAVAEGREPKFHDKQPVRDWAAGVVTPFFDDKGTLITGVNNLKPEIPEHVTYVHGLSVPVEVITAATSRYLAIFEMITGRSLLNYQVHKLGCRK